jgi:hypothetical protein
VTDECKPLVTRDTRYGFASYLGTTKHTYTTVSAAVAQPNGDFLFAGQLGALGVLTTNESYVEIDMSGNATGCAASPGEADHFNASTGHACMATIIGLEGGGCPFEMDPGVSCGGPKSATYLGDKTVHDMKRSHGTGALVVAAPDGILRVSASANATVWNACEVCGGNAVAVCRPLCPAAYVDVIPYVEGSGTKIIRPEVRVACGSSGKIIAVIHIDGARSTLLTLNATTGAVLARVTNVGGGDGVKLTDVAVIAEMGTGSNFAAKVVVSGSTVGVPVETYYWRRDPVNATLRTEVAFIRAYDAVTGAGPVWKTWDYGAEDMEQRDLAFTRIKCLTVDRSGRLIAAGEAQGFEIPGFNRCVYPSGQNVFRWDGTSTGTFRSASRELGLRPKHMTVKHDKDMHSNVFTKFQYSSKMAFTGIIDPVSGQVIRGQFLSNRETFPGQGMCVEGYYRRGSLLAGAGLTLEALDVDSKGNIIIGGGSHGDLYQRDTITSNNYPTAQRAEAYAEPYFAVYDANLKVRSKWTSPQQMKQAKASNPGLHSNNARYLTGGSGYVTAIAGGAFCPDNYDSFGSCTSAFAVNGQPNEFRGGNGALFATANALQVKGENNKWGPNSDRCASRDEFAEMQKKYVNPSPKDQCTTDAYAAIFNGPAQLGDFAVCNPLDFKEPPAKLVWARMALARTVVDVRFDADIDRGETGGLTLGGVFACNKLFTDAAASSMGAGCTSYFLDKRTARTVTGAGHNVTEADDGQTNGTMVQIRGGVVYNDRFRDKGQSSTASAVVTRAPGEFISVNAILRCDPEVSVPSFDVMPENCPKGFTAISAVQSTGRVGNVPLAYRWSLDTSVFDGGNLDRANALNTWLSNKITSHVLVPNEMLINNGDHEWHVFVSNKPGHVWTKDDRNAMRAKCTTKHVPVTSPIRIGWCDPLALPSPKTENSRSSVTACVGYEWHPCFADRTKDTTVDSVPWTLTGSPGSGPGGSYDRVVGWSTTTGLHPDVIAQEARLSAIAASVTGLRLKVPKNHMFGGRKYSFRARIVVRWNGTEVGRKYLSRSPTMKYAKMFSVIRDSGSGGETSEYDGLARGKDLEFIPTGIFDTTVLRPRLVRDEWLTRRHVDPTIQNYLHAMEDVRIDPEWRTDTHELSHEWYCEDIYADRDSCQLNGEVKGRDMMQIIDGMPAGDDLWPGSPLTLPAASMAPDSVYTFTLMSTKPDRQSTPDMSQLVTGNGTCPTADIEATASRVNTQYLYRIYGKGFSALGEVQ